MASFNPIEVNGVYYIRCRDPRKREVRLKIPSAKNRAKAERLAEEYETKYNFGEVDPWEFKDKQQSYSDISLSSLVNLYLKRNKNRWKGGTDGHSYITKQSRLNRLQDILNPGMPVSQITYQHVNNIVNDLDVRQTSKKAYLRTFKAFFNWARKEEIMDMRTKKIQLDRQPVTKLTGYITAGDLQKIIDTYLEKMEGNKLYADVWHFTFYNGPRMSEIPSILKKHVDLDNKYIQVGSEEFVAKHNMENRVPIAPENLELVTTYYHNTKSPDKPLFDVGGAYTSNLFTKAAKRTFPGRRKRWGIHLLRHSCAMYLMNEKGWHEEEVQEFLRHTSSETVKQYRHGAPSKLRDKLYGNNTE